MTCEHDEGGEGAKQSSRLRVSRRSFQKIAQPFGNNRLQRGQALVEFALAAVLALTLMFGIIEFGRAIFAYDLVANAARIGTRYAIVNATPCNNGVTAPCELAVKSYILSKSSGIDGSKLQAHFTWGSTSTTCSGTANPGCYVGIEVDYPFSFILLPLPAQTLKSTSQMVISQGFSTPSPSPSALPTPSPSALPTSSPSATPSASPSASPIPSPSPCPTKQHLNSQGNCV